MGRLKFGGESEFKQIAKKVLETHKNTFEKLAESEKMDKEPTIVKEVHTIEKQQDIHHHKINNITKTVDKRTRKYAKALRNESYKQRENLHRLLNVVQRVQSERMDKQQLQIDELLNRKPEEKQIVTEIREIHHVLDKKLLIFNGLLIFINLMLLMFK